MALNKSVLRCIVSLSMYQFGGTNMPYMEVLEYHVIN
ncbi:unnamed protein product [Musa acuminata subsp. malaccensis]|uniref:(wild Malaysian banana) hypothetical protein n=1 Tax=Musa acuminata subsp. malaccensis TaxID=214687 RepID=A0A804HXS3_MUSAM|nr:unnamed protein product [Musa acuminata subsp. malaccensis]